MVAVLDKLGGGGVSRSISIAYGTILRLIS